MKAENESREQIQNRKIIDYYNEAQKYYYFLWHGNSLGLHYGFWSEDVKNRKEAILKENEVFANLAGIKEGDLVLDAGNGVGGSGIWLAEKRQAKIVGLNLVMKQLKEGRKIAGRKNLSAANFFTAGSFQEMSFANETFDVVWSLESIEHATSVEIFIKECFRVLKPGGKIIIAGTFKGRDTLSAEEQRQLDVGMSAAGAFNDFRTANQVGEIIEEAGFSNLQNIDRKDLIMKSAIQMRDMCIWGLPVAKSLKKMGFVSDIMVTNNEWGTYQQGLFESGATSYNILIAQKP